MSVDWNFLKSAFFFSDTTFNATLTAFSVSSAADQQSVLLIQNALVNLYNNSITAKNIIDQGFTNKITIYKYPQINSSGGQINSPGGLVSRFISINTNIVNYLQFVALRGQHTNCIISSTMLPSLHGTPLPHDPSPPHHGFVQLVSFPRNADG